MDVLLEMKGLSKSFGVVKALDDVNIILRKNEILGLVGENGAGKSTLMKILSGSYPHSNYTGEIIIEGKTCKFSSPPDAQVCGIEMIYQEISMHPDLSIAENIFLGQVPTRYGFISRRELNRKSKYYLDMVGLNMPPSTLVRRLSTSQQQMVAIARALSRNPKILILDEPTSSLTEAEVVILHNNLLRIKAEGISCIYISHKIKEIFKLCDRITTLRDGRVINTSEVLNEQEQTPIIIQEMVGRKIDVLYPKERVPIGDEVLRIENFTIAHPTIKNRNIAQDISLKVHAGEIVALAGLVGAGRSEVVNAIFGAMKKSSGDIYVQNQKITINNPCDAIKAGIGLVTEDRKETGIISVFNIKRNISLTSIDDDKSIIWLNRKAETALAGKFMDELSIKAPGAETMILNLSGGNQQKVVLAKWLAKNLKVIILDEPTRGIDVGAKSQIYDIMTSLVKAGLGIILISSELPELVAMCDRMYVLSNGKIRAELSGGEINDSNMMKAAITDD